MQTQPEILKFLCCSFFSQTTIAACTRHMKKIKREKSPVYTTVIKCSNIEICVLLHQTHCEGKRNDEKNDKRTRGEKLVVFNLISLRKQCRVVRNSRGKSARKHRILWWFFLTRRRRNDDEVDERNDKLRQMNNV